MHKLGTVRDNPDALPFGVDPPEPGGMPRLFGPIVLIIELLINSPRSPIYSSMEPSQGKQNRCYYSDKYGFFEWKLISKTEMEAYTYQYYDHIDGVWRGVCKTNTLHFSRVGDHWEFVGDDNHLYIVTFS